MRRKALLAVGGLSAAGSFAFGSDAFTSVSAERAVEVEVVGDATAYLGLEPGGGGEQYAELRGGELTVELSPANDDVAGDGVNADAVTVIEDLFRVTNRGTQQVSVWIDHDSEYVTFESGGVPIETEGALSLTPGEPAAQVDMVVDTHGAPTDEPLLESVTVNAVATDGEGESPPVDTSPTRTVEALGDDRYRVTFAVPTTGAGTDVDVYERWGAGATAENVSATPAADVTRAGDGGAVALFDGVTADTVEVSYEVTLAEGSATVEPNTVDVDGTPVAVAGRSTLGE